jgi:hypothetical protein
MTGTHQRFRLQDFAEPFGQARGAKNFAEKQNRAARIGDLRDIAEGTGELRITRKLVSSGVKPGVDRGVGSAKLRLQFAGIAWGIVHQESGIDAEKAGQQISGSAGHVRTCAAFDLRQIGLAKAASEFLLHGQDHLGLRQRAAQTAERPLDRAKGANFVAKSHGRRPFENIAICEIYIAICNFVKRNLKVVQGHINLLFTWSVSSSGFGELKFLSYFLRERPLCRRSFPRLRTNMRRRFFKQLCQFGDDSSGPIQSLHEHQPLFGRNNEFSHVGQDVFGLQASAVQDEFSDTDAGRLRTRANQSLLWCGSSKINGASGCFSHEQQS